jgi:hypothetical protein
MRCHSSARPSVIGFGEGFAGLHASRVHPGGTHRAFNRIDDVIAANTRWLVTALS